MSSNKRISFKSGSSSSAAPDTKIMQVSRGGKMTNSALPDQQTTSYQGTQEIQEGKYYSKMQSKQMYMEEGSETMIVKRRIVTTTTTGQTTTNSQNQQEESSLYSKTMNKITTNTNTNITSTNTDTNNLKAIASIPKSTKPVTTNSNLRSNMNKKPEIKKPEIRKGNTTMNKSRPQLKSSPSDPKLLKKAVKRGGDYDNILITHVIYTTDPNTEFHIIDPLDTEFADRAPIDLQKLRANKKLRDPKFGKSSFSSSCENWNPKPKETGINRSMVYEHIGGQHTHRDLSNSSSGTKGNSYRANKTAGYTGSSSNKNDIRYSKKGTTNTSSNIRRKNY